MLIFYESPAGAFPISWAGLPGRFSPGSPFIVFSPPGLRGGQEVRKVDPHAFFMVQEGVHTLGNFKRHLNP